jgi:glycogen operon protein
MIDLRKSRRAIARSRFWREDVRWHGTGTDVDMAHESRSLAFYLRGARFGEGDLYVMINSFWRPLQFYIQEGEAGEWSRILDTSLPSPDDISEPGGEIPVPSLDYKVSSRSVVVLGRRFTGDSEDNLQ